MGWTPVADVKAEAISREITELGRKATDLPRAFELTESRPRELERFMKLQAVRLGGDS